VASLSSQDLPSISSGLIRSTKRSENSISFDVFFEITSAVYLARCSELDIKLSKSSSDNLLAKVLACSWPFSLSGVLTD
jgi:hypothetical protein